MTGILPEKGGFLPFDTSKNLIELMYSGQELNAP